jgi:hypothetical protein
MISIPFKFLSIFFLSFLTFSDISVEISAVQVLPSEHQRLAATALGTLGLLRLRLQAQAQMVRW